MMASWTEFLAAHGATLESGATAHFTSREQELVAARDAAVLCDLTPLATLRVTGPDAVIFLQGQLTNDVAALERDSAQYSAWCSPKGRMLANFLLLRVDTAAFEVLLPASMAEAVRKRLAMFVLRSKVAIEDTTGEWVRIGVGGASASASLQKAGVDVPARFQMSSLDGERIMALPGNRFVVLTRAVHAEALWHRLSAIALPAGYPVWQWLTIRAGVPVITPATSDQLVPQMANWDALEGVSFRKGCYTGQEIVARTQYLGRLKERTSLAHVDASPPAAGEKLYSGMFGEQSCGMVLNAAPSPEGGSDFLAALQIAAAQSGDVRIASPVGTAISLLPLPYPLPGGQPESSVTTAAPRGRVA